MIPTMPTRLIAWTPLLKPQLIRLLAIRCPSTQQLDRDLYLSYLSDRVQAMVDALPEEDHVDAVRQFQEEMFSTGLVREVGFCPADEVGVTLVMSNSEIWEKLSNLGVSQRLRKARYPLIENLMAHQALMSDRENPVDNLTMWAWRMGQVE
jgi:hypothetical protein